MPGGIPDARDIATNGTDEHGCPVESRCIGDARKLRLSDFPGSSGPSLGPTPHRTPEGQMVKQYVGERRGFRSHLEGTFSFAV